MLVSSEPSSAASPRGSASRPSENQHGPPPPRAQARAPHGARELPGAADVVEQEDGDPREGHARDGPGQRPPETEPHRQREDRRDALDHVRAGDEAHALVPLHEPEVDVAQRLRALRDRDDHDREPRLPGVHEDGQRDDRREGERQRDQAQGEVVAEPVRLAGVGRLHAAQVEVRGHHHGRRDGEGEREPPDELRGADLRDDDQHRPLAAPVHGVAGERPRHVPAEADARAGRRLRVLGEALRDAGHGGRGRSRRVRAVDRSDPGAHGPDPRVGRAPAAPPPRAAALAASGVHPSCRFGGHIGGSRGGERHGRGERRTGRIGARAPNRNERGWGIARAAAGRPGRPPGSRAAAPSRWPTLALSGRGGRPYRRWCRRGAGAPRGTRRRRGGGARRRADGHRTGDGLGGEQILRAEAEADLRRVRRGGGARARLPPARRDRDRAPRHPGLAGPLPADRARGAPGPRSRSTSSARCGRRARTRSGTRPNGSA